MNHGLCNRMNSMSREFFQGAQRGFVEPVASLRDATIGDAYSCNGRKCASLDCRNGWKPPCEIFLVAVRRCSFLSAVQSVPVTLASQRTFMQFQFLMEALRAVIILRRTWCYTQVASVFDAYGTARMVFCPL
jgi:hypothetical protein